MTSESPQSELDDRKHLHSLISNSTYRDLKSFALKYGSISKVIEEAIVLLKIRDHDINSIDKKNLEPAQLWDLMRSDFNMMAVGRRTFLSYIQSLPTEPWNENNALELIEWYYNNVTITELHIYQVLTALKEIWIAGNYFRTITIEPLDSQDYLTASRFRLIFNHDFNEPKYGQYWGEYFKTVLEKSPLYYKIIKLEIRNQFFRMEVSK